MKSYSTVSRAPELESYHMQDTSLLGKVLLIYRGYRKRILSVSSLAFVLEVGELSLINSVCNISYPSSDSRLSSYKYVSFVLMPMQKLQIKTSESFSSYNTAYYQ